MSRAEKAFIVILFIILSMMSVMREGDAGVRYLILAYGVLIVGMLVDISRRL